MARSYRMCWALGSLMLLSAASCQALSGIDDLTVDVEGSDGSVGSSAGGSIGAAGGGTAGTALGTGGTVGSGTGGSGTAGSGLGGNAGGSAGSSTPDAGSSDNGDSGVGMKMKADAPLDVAEERALGTKPDAAPDASAPAPLCFGHCDPFQQGSEYFSDHLVAVPVSVNQPAKANGLGIFTTQDNGQKVILALYTDLSGHPDKLVAVTPPGLLNLGRNVVNFDVPVAIQAGTYWVAFGLGGATFIGTSPNPQSEFYVLLLNFGASPPTTFPIPPPIMPYMTDSPNVFIVAQ